MATRVRVVTLNVWNSRGDAAARSALINAELRRLAPDLVAFQEVLPDQLPRLIAGTELHGTHQSQSAATAPPYADRCGRGHRTPGTPARPPPQDRLRPRRLPARAPTCLRPRAERLSRLRRADRRRRGQ
ncbi:endonuclease/exonuclease/phosphatase family protein [Streptomyces sp. Je 1-332]|uniref:endonuclease/exonuclease/phosphatase family protein n=1 Tax=Streptomyces sp. Je 1-332 TaxID=3231270 RepID=UPI003459004B